LFDAWESYAKALVASLPTPEAENLKNSIVNEINAVATTSGGLLGWAAISTGEHKVMNRIVAALTQA
jgi:predicted phosphoadenosine phosphosulfate sulfurtransferase